MLGGLVASGDCQITAGSGMHVLVGTGEVWVPGTSVATQSGYYARVSSSTELVIAASDPSNPRIDRVSAIVKDKAYTGTEDAFSVAVETGTPTSGATLVNLSGAAAAPTSSYTLGYVLVPAGSSSVTGGNIANTATVAVPGLQAATYIEGTAAARPAAGVKGRVYYATDTKFYSVDTGSTWLEVTAPNTNKYTARSFSKAEAEAGAEVSATRPAIVNITGGGVGVTTVGGVSAGSGTGLYLFPGQKIVGTEALTLKAILL